jgi:hypothetical protein
LEKLVGKAPNRGDGMKEIQGELWDYYGTPNTLICLTTNGAVKKNGEGVMGRGCAYEATQRIPGIAKTLGRSLSVYGNQFIPDTQRGFAFFPVKHHWREQADLNLIQRSAEALDRLSRAVGMRDWTFILPRPGCGNGRLGWPEVKRVIEFLPDNVWVIYKLQQQHHVVSGAAENANKFSSL